LSATSGPHSIAVAVTAKNIPPECFLNAATVLKEIIYPEWDLSRLLCYAGEFILFQVYITITCPIKSS
jgi:hypothetical protein